MTDSVKMTKFRAWLLAARPKTLPAAVGPVIVGASLAYADGVFRLLPALAAFAAALLMQVAVNVANDYFDSLHGYDTADRLGPARAAATGMLSRREMVIGLLVLIALTGLVGIYLVIAGGWPMAAMGVAAVLSLLAYSAGPLPLAANGLGDVFVFLFFGLVAVGGTYYGQARQFTPWLLLAGALPGLLITAILVVNNIRDRDTDARVAKKTLAVRWGLRFSRAEFIALIALSYLLLPLFFLPGPYSPWVLLALLTLPLAVRVIRSIMNETGSILNRTLAATAGLSLLFCLLLSLGLILS